MDLLPPEEKQKLLGEKRLKKIIIFNLVLFSALVCFTLMLLVVQINLNAKLAFQKTILEQREQEFESSQIKELEEEVIFFNSIFADIGTFIEEKFFLSNIFDELSSLIPAGIHLSNLSFQKTTLEFSLSGHSPTREVLLKLKENLEQSKGFRDIYFPSSNWISPTDIDFLAKFKFSK